jgi:hypothetical protein
VKGRKSGYTFCILEMNYIETGMNRPIVADILDVRTPSG